MGTHRDLTVRFRGCPGEEALTDLRRVLGDAGLTTAEESTSAGERRVVYERDPGFGTVRVTVPIESGGYDLRVVVGNQPGPVAWLRAVALVGRAFAATDLSWGTTRPGYTPRDPGRHTVREADPTAVGTVAYFDPGIAGQVGRDRLRSSPALARRDLDDGGLVLVAALEPDTGRVDTVREYLADPGSASTESTLDSFPSHREPHPVYRLPSREGPPPALPERVAAAACDDVIAVLEQLGTWDRAVAEDELWTDTTETADRLDALLDDERPPVRREAAWALWVGARDGVDGLEPLLREASEAREDGDAVVRDVAIEGLRELAQRDTPEETGEEHELTDEDLPVSTAAGDAVRSRALNDPDPDVRATAVRTLQYYLPQPLDEQRVLETYRAVFEQDPSTVARRGAVLGSANVLGEGRLPSDLDLLFEALDDDSETIRRTAAEEFPNLPTASARSSISKRKVEGLLETVPAHEERVLRAVDAPETEVQAIAVHLLVFLETEEATEILARAANHEEPGIRKAAAKAYSLTEPDVAAEALAPFLEDETEEVRRKTAFLLYKYAERRPGAFSSAIPLLVELLDDPSADVQKWAGRALGVLRGPQAVEALVDRLDSENAAVVRASIQALGKIGDQRAVDPLVEFLDDAAWNEQVHVVEALERIGGERGRQGLRAAVRKTYSDANDRARSALEQFDEEG